MIGRLSGRDAFTRLRVEGRRSSRGPIRIVHYETAEPGTTPSNEIPRVAFSIPRNVGNAVVRNRTKRRLRAVIDEIDRSDTDRLRGDYLIRVTAPLDRWSPTELTAAMTELLTSTRVPR